ncbi:iron-containing redox enzyme family protein [Dapis sp. BLCC M126]|uniref:iron-containing redox enzyme family protein n=1 Tax=Dapis sp. BLCC M126 TaxID=3400189 RepID=UPI003CE6B5C1
MLTLQSIENVKDALGSIEDVENLLRSKFHKQLTEPGIKNPVKFLQRWSYISTQITRLLGAALSRAHIADVQFLLAEIAYGECGFGNRYKMHSKLMIELINKSPYADAITQRLDTYFLDLFEKTVLELSHMSQEEAIGFIVSLEAPAYQILELLKQTCIAVGISEIDFLNTEYFLIHNAIEKEHQESGNEAMQIILDNGFELSKIYKGGEKGIKFITEFLGC